MASSPATISSSDDETTLISNPPESTPPSSPDTEPKPPESTPPSSPVPQPEPPESTPPSSPDPQPEPTESAAPVGDGAPGEGDEEEDEEGECPFCLFMKGGGCKESFIAWEKCVEEAEKTGEDVVEKCFEVTSLLKKCMDAHADYYEPVLRAEQTMADAVAAEDKERPPETSESSKSPESEK